MNKDLYKLFLFYMISKVVKISVSSSVVSSTASKSMYLGAVSIAFSIYCLTMCFKSLDLIISKAVEMSTPAIVASKFERFIKKIPSRHLRIAGMFPSAVFITPSRHNDTVRYGSEPPANKNRPNFSYTLIDLQISSV